MDRLPGYQGLPLWSLHGDGGKENGRLHLSISHKDRLPTWDEIKEIRERLLPADAFMCIPFPPKKHWVNVHAYCLHLWEHKDQHLVEQCILEGEVFKALGSPTLHKEK